jgi:surface polysaccharide O-acyltransferase-like enzyme
MLGLALGAYHSALHLREFVGIRLTMAPALVMIGYWFKRSGFRVGGCSASFSVMVAAILVILEEALIARLGGANFTSHDIVLMTYPLGSAIFLLALSINPNSPLSALAMLGRVSLGVYASHLLFVYTLLPWTGQSSFPRACILAAATVCSATVLSLVLARMPVIRRLVS